MITKMSLECRICKAAARGVLLLAGLWMLPRMALSGQPPPNVIVILADDLGYGDVGFNGSERIRTPELDRMAAEGLVFDRFYTASPLCSPTRGSCLTGRHPFRYGVLAAHSGGMRTGERTLAEIFSDQGYATGIFGKWHLGWVRPDAELDQRGYYSPPWHHGFDVCFVTKSAVPTWNPSVTPPGWNAWNNFEGEMWSSSMYVMNGELVTENLNGDDSRVIMDRALPFIEEAVSSGTPFFTCIWFHTPHEPVVAGPAYRAMYDSYTEKAQHYYGAVTAMDEQIGRLRRRLKEVGADEHTILWFVSDNGPSGHLVKEGIASAGKFRGTKHTVYEGGLRVPAILEWPGRIGAGRSDFPCGTVDMLPTLLELAELPRIPDDRPMDGISLDRAIFEAAEERQLPMAFGWARLHSGIHALAWTGYQYKLVVHPLDDAMELYDLLNDPEESADLSSALPGIVKQMAKDLAEWQESCRLSRDGKDYTY